MNYKKIVRSRKLRFKILSALSWIPDKFMIPLQYKIHTGRSLNTKNPERYTEKLQLYKMRYRNEDMLRCTDKYHVRGFVEDQGLKDILIPLIGKYDSPEEIDFNSLPDAFVAKATDGGGGGQVLVCRDKSRLTAGEFYATLGEWMRIPKPAKPFGREWAYENGYPRAIVIEELISEPGTDDLKDYKFMCFNGKVGLVYGIHDRQLGTGARVGLYTPEFELLDVSENEELPETNALSRPANYERMVEIAGRLSKSFPHVRVDLYNVEGKIYFGELTFYDGSGYLTYNPDSFDFELGKLFTEYQ